MLDGRGRDPQIMQAMARGTALLIHLGREATQYFARVRVDCQTSFNQAAPSSSDSTP